MAKESMDLVGLVRKRAAEADVHFLREAVLVQAITENPRIGVNSRVLPRPSRYPRIRSHHPDGHARRRAAPRWAQQFRYPGG